MKLELVSDNLWNDSRSEHISNKIYSIIINLKSLKYSKYLKYVGMQIICSNRG